MPGLSVNASGTWKTITGAYVRVSGTWKRFIGGWVNVSGTWKRILAAAPTVTASPGSVSGTGTTTTTTATIDGGVGPFTIEWQYVSGDVFATDFSTWSLLVTATAGGSLTTAWTITPTGPAPGMTLVSVWRAAVTDTATSLVSYSNGVTVSATHS